MLNQGICLRRMLGVGSYGAATVVGGGPDRIRVRIQHNEGRGSSDPGTGEVSPPKNHKTPRWEDAKLRIIVLI